MSIIKMNNELLKDQLSTYYRVRRALEEQAKASETDALRKVVGLMAAEDRFMTMQEIGDLAYNNGICLTGREIISNLGMLPYIQQFKTATTPIKRRKGDSRYGYIHQLELSGWILVKKVVEIPRTVEQDGVIMLTGKVNRKNYYKLSHRTAR